MNETDDLNLIEKINRRLIELALEQERLLMDKAALEDDSKQKIHRKPALSTEQKVDLFIQIFQGRTDVFAQRWENKNGRNGYSVSCHNEWVTGLCNKPRVKCNECRNRKFKALNHREIYDHLAGMQVVGLYPLLLNNSCHLLAVDFDKDDWKPAIKAMAKSCQQCDIPYAIEISRSGKEAHLWVFFSEWVVAKEARKLGFALLDKAMEIHPELSFESYDRLFPNQDIMPEGGFGNLIALPLQFHARKNGNSIFVDAQLLRYPNQWGFLSQLKKVSADQLGNSLVKLQPQSQLAIDARPPWEQGEKIQPVQIENCPRSIVLVLANHIYFKMDELPSTLIARLKRLASFSNPVFFKTQALRFSTHGIPRYITCARIESGYLSLPRGCFDDAIQLLNEQEIDVELDDKRQSGMALTGLKFLGDLRKDQAKAVKIMTAHDTGVLHAPTAFGKTVAAIGIIAKRKISTLILTHSRQLLDQWQERLKSFLYGVDIGIIGGGKRKPTGQIDIATYQSFIDKKDNTVNDQIQDYGQIIIDECHHISSPRFEIVLNEARARYVLGLTATPDRQDGHQKIIFMLAGPVRHKVKINHADHFRQIVVVSRLVYPPPEDLVGQDARPRITDIYRWLTENHHRTDKILEDVLLQIDKGKHPLILTERREHARQINQLLLDKGMQTAFLRGGMGAREREAANELLADAQAVVATGKYIGEGFDLPRLDTLFLTLPIAWKGSLSQYAGRIHRESAGKEQVTIFDYVDESLPVLARMFKKREKGYKAMGYQIAEVIPEANKQFIF